MATTKKQLKNATLGHNGEKGRIFPITAERAGKLRDQGKMTLHYSSGTALHVCMERGKKKIYRLPNGVFGVMK